MKRVLIFTMAVVLCIASMVWGKESECIYVMDFTHSMYFDAKPNPDHTRVNMTDEGFTVEHCMGCGNHMLFDGILGYYENRALHFIHCFVCERVTTFWKGINP